MTEEWDNILLDICVSLVLFITPNFGIDNYVFSESVLF